MRKIAFKILRQIIFKMTAEGQDASDRRPRILLGQSSGMPLALELGSEKDF